MKATVYVQHRDPQRGHIAWPSNCSVEDARIHHPAHVTCPPGTEKQLCQNPVYVNLYFNLYLIRLRCKDWWKSFLLGPNPTICPDAEATVDPRSGKYFTPHLDERSIASFTGTNGESRKRGGGQSVWELAQTQPGDKIREVAFLDFCRSRPAHTIRLHQQSWSTTRQTSSSWEGRSLTIFSGQRSPSRVHFLRKLKQASFPIGSSPRSVEITLIHANATSCSTMDKKAVQRVIRSAGSEDVLLSRCRNETQSSDSPRNTTAAEDAPPLDSTTASCLKLSRYLILILFKCQHWAYIPFYL